MIKRQFDKLKEGYSAFREKYTRGVHSDMKLLAQQGQRPQFMVVACCDSRVDPALILQCDPGDLFVVRNVANIIPQYAKDDKCHGTSAALEFGVCFLKVKALILLGHSQCGGIESLLCKDEQAPTDFIKPWVDQVKNEAKAELSTDEYAKYALKKSYKNCLTFPWLKERVDADDLDIYLWFFDIKAGQISTYCNEQRQFQPLDVCSAEDL